MVKNDTPIKRARNGEKPREAYQCLSVGLQTDFILLNSKGNAVSIDQF